MIVDVNAPFSKLREIDSDDVPVTGLVSITSMPFSSSDFWIDSVSLEAPRVWLGAISKLWHWQFAPQQLEVPVELPHVTAILTDRAIPARSAAIIAAFTLSM